LLREGLEGRATDPASSVPPSPPDPDATKERAGNKLPACFWYIMRPD